MNLEQYRAISKPLYAEIETVLAKYGLAVKKINAGVNAELGEIGLSLKLADKNLKAADGSATTAEALRWKQSAQWLGLQVEWLDKELAFGAGKWHRVVGLRNTRSDKNVVLHRDGKTFYAAPDHVKRAAAIGIR